MKVSPNIIINFSTAVITFIFGLLLLTGLLFPGGNNSSMMIMFGIVLMIYGVFRFITTMTKIKQIKLEERRQKFDSEREKFLKDL